MVSLKTVKKLSVELWTLFTLNGCHLGYVVEGKGPLFKQEMAAEDVVTENSRKIMRELKKILGNYNRIYKM